MLGVVSEHRFINIVSEHILKVKRKKTILFTMCSLIGDFLDNNILKIQM